MAQVARGIAPGVPVDVKIDGPGRDEGHLRRSLAVPDRSLDARDAAGLEVQGARHEGAVEEQTPANFRSAHVAKLPRNQSPCVP